MAKRTLLIKSIGLIIFLGILIFVVDLKKVGAVFLNVQLPYLLAAMLLLFLSTSIEPYRWQYILKKVNIIYSYKQIYRYFFLAASLGVMTPIRLGEIGGRLAILKKDGHDLGKSLMSIFIDRLADFILIIFLIVLGIIYFFLPQEKGILPLIGLMGLILVIWLFFSLAKKNSQLFNLFIPNRLKPMIKKYFWPSLSLLKKIKFKNYLFIFLVTAFAWSMNYLALFTLAKGLALTMIPFFYFIISLAVASLISLLPITVGGLGTRESVLLLLFSAWQVPPELTIAFSISVGILSISLILSIGLVCWLWPVKKSVI